MSYREIRVRPVVRYVLTDFQCDENYGNQKSIALGEFENVDYANVVAYALATSAGREFGPDAVPVVEPARKLRIDWLRGPGEPQEAIRWVLSEVAANTQAPAP